MTVTAYRWIVGWSIGCQRKHRTMNWKKKRRHLALKLKVNNVYLRNYITNYHKVTQIQYTLLCFSAIPAVIKSSKWSFFPLNNLWDNGTSMQVKIVLFQQGHFLNCFFWKWSTLCPSSQRRKKNHPDCFQLTVQKANICDGVGRSLTPRAEGTCTSVMVPLMLNGTCRFWNTMCSHPEDVFFQVHSCWLQDNKAVW